MVHSDRAHAFEVGTAELWATMGRVDHYRRWWPWLRTFDGASFEAGAVWRCRVQPPLPYRLRFTIELTEVEERQRIVAVVDGDIAGRAEVTVAGDDRGSSLRLVSDLQPRHRGLRVVAELTPGIAQWGHDWVLDTGLVQFRRRGLGRG